MKYVHAADKRFLKVFLIGIAFFFVSITVYSLILSQGDVHPLRWITGKADPLCPTCNVLVLSLDTVSSRHLPCYGYYRNTAPNLCAYADNHIQFRTAYANASWTLPSDISLFTSLYPAFHGIEDYSNDSMQLPARATLLPYVLKQAGYHTIFAIPANDPTFPVKEIYNRGVSEVIPVGSGSTENLDEALSRFAQVVRGGQKTFMYVHSYKAHGPYFIQGETMFTDENFPDIPLTGAGIYENFSQDFYVYLLNQLSQVVGKPNAPVSQEFFDKLKNAPTLEAAHQLAQSRALDLDSYYMEYFYFAKIDLTDQRQVEYIKALYDQRLFELDEWIGRVLIPFLDSPLVKENTIVIITSEHGEEFMEHGRILHETLYDSNVAVPLIVSVPGYKKQVIQVPAQVVDVMPTLLDMVGLNNRQYFFQGRSLVDAIVGIPVRNRFLYASQRTGKSGQIITMRNEQWKVFMMDDGTTYIPYELYHIQSDPQEAHNVLTERLDVAKRLAHQATLYMKKWRTIVHDYQKK